MTLAALLAARWFGPASWGQLGILLAGVQLISMVGDGFFPTIIKYVSEARALGRANAPAVGWRLMWVSVAALSAASAALCIVSYAVFSHQVEGRWIILAMGLAIARAWRPCLEGIYRGLQLFRAPALAGATSAVLTAGSIIVAAALGYRVTAYLLIMLSGSALNCILLGVAYQRSFKKQPKAVGHQQTEPADLSTEPATEADQQAPEPRTSEFLRYSFPLAMRGIWTFLFLKINIWMLGAMASDTDAGQFRLTDQFLTLPTLVLSAVLAAVAPRIVQAQLAGKAHLELFISRVYGLMFALTLPLAFFFWFNQPVIGRLFPAYGEASQMLAYFAPAMLIIGVGYAASIVPVQGGKPGLALGITIVSGIANVICAYVGYKIWGVKGLAIATACVHFLTYFIGTIVIHWAFGLRFRIRFS